jgi:hypothetical protein
MIEDGRRTSEEPPPEKRNDSAISRGFSVRVVADDPKTGIIRLKVDSPKKGGDSDAEILTAAAEKGAEQMLRGTANTIAGAVQVPLLQTLDALGVKNAKERADEIIARNKRYFLQRADEILRAGGAVEVQIQLQALARRFCSLIAERIRNMRKSSHAGHPSA